MTFATTRRPAAALALCALIGALLTSVPPDAAHAQSSPSLRIEDAADFATAGKLAFTVTLANPPAGSVFVSYQTVNGTAVAPTHYTSTSGSLEFSSGVTERTIEVDVSNTGPSPDRTFTVHLSQPQNATIGRGTGQGTIWNAAGPTVTFKEVSRQVGEPAAGDTAELTFSVVAEGSDFTRDVSVRYRTADPDADDVADGQSKARAGIDYDATEGTLVIEAPPSGNVAEATVTVTVHGNDVYQGGGSAVFRLVLSEPASGVFRDGNALSREPRVAVGLIQDSDGPPVVSVGSVAAAEGNTGTTPAVLPITLSHASAFPIKLVHATADGAATVTDDDYVPVPPGTPVPVIPPLATKASLPVHMKGDTRIEPNEHFFVDLALADPDDKDVVLAQDGSRATVTVLNDDGPYFTIDDVEGFEGDDGERTPYEFTVRLHQVPGDWQNTVTVDYETVDDTATSDQPGFEDYEPVEGTLEFPPGVTAQTVTVEVIGDSNPGYHEIFHVDLSNVTIPGGPATIPPVPTLFKERGVGTAWNDDGPELTVADAVAVRDRAALLDATFEVTLSEPLDCPEWFQSLYGCDVLLRYRTVDGTALAGEHYHAQEGILRIPPGETRGEITVQVFGGEEPGPSHTFALDLEPAEFAVSTQRAVTGEIRNGFGPELTVGDLTLERPRSGTAEAVFPVTLAEASEHDVSLTFATVDGTAVAGEDYIARSGTVQIPTGETSTEIIVRVNAATATARPQANFDLALSQPAYAKLTDDVATATLDGGLVPGEVLRTFGADRIATAVAISREFWSAAEDVVVATAGSYPDALGAGALTAKLDAPLLLTHTHRLHEDVAAELTRLGAQRAWVMGGTAAISQATEDALVAAGLEVRRLGGADRFATAAVVAAEVGAPEGQALLALGTHQDEARAWPDALSAGALAAGGEQLPTLLTRGGSLPAETEQALGELGVQQVYVIGGTAAIADAVVGQLQAMDIEVFRLAGPDRYGTSAAVANEALRRSAPGRVPIVFATGHNFPDGLAAAGLTARLGGVLLLVPLTRLDAAPATGEFVAANGPKLGGGVITGGTAAVSDTVLEQLRDGLREHAGADDDSFDPDEPGPDTGEAEPEGEGEGDEDAGAQ